VFVEQGDVFTKQAGVLSEQGETVMKEKKLQ
jgi:hypothetical protein